MQKPNFLNHIESTFWSTVRYMKEGVKQLTF